MVRGEQKDANPVWQVKETFLIAFCSGVRCSSCMLSYGEEITASGASMVALSGERPNPLRP
jgi:hypothetical protein